MRILRLFFGASIALTIASLLFVLTASTRGASTALTFTVNSTADVPDITPGDGVCETATNNGICTLRAAIMEANHTPGGGATIRFGLSGVVTYLLTIPPSGTDGEASGDLNVTNTMTIIGNGAANTIIDGNGTDRVFNIGSGTTTLIISGVTIQNGNSSGLNAFGGGILNNGTLTLTNSAVRQNSANSTSGGSYGGGIYNSFTLSLTLVNSAIMSNSANTASGIASGGGIIGGETLINSTVSGNTARNGGGIYASTLTFINSTISGNHANDNGGGIYAVAGTNDLFNTTIAYNQANADDSGFGYGGGVYNAGSTFNFKNSIIAWNTVIVPGVPYPTLDLDDCSGTMTSQGYNIVYTVPYYCSVTGSYIQADPYLGPLQNNGGRTETHALLKGSPAIDAGESPFCTDPLGAPITQDQRGVPRSADGCDIGAYEYQWMVFLPLVTR